MNQHFLSLAACSSSLFRLLALDTVMSLLRSRAGGSFVTPMFSTCGCESMASFFKSAEKQLKK